MKIIENCSLCKIECANSHIDVYTRIVKDYLAMMAKIESSTELMLEYTRNYEAIELLLTNISEKKIEIEQEVENHKLQEKAS